MKFKGNSNRSNLFRLIVVKLMLVICCKLRNRDIRLELGVSIVI